MPDDPAVWKRVEEEFGIGSTAYGRYKRETKSDITSFCSLGAKNYSFCTADGEEVVKSRGFDLASLIAKAKVNHEVMVDLLKKYLKKEEASVSCPSFRMTVDRRAATIRNTPFEKVYGNSCFDKRIVMSRSEEFVDTSDTAATLPFGLTTLNFVDCNRSDVA